MTEHEEPDPEAQEAPEAPQAGEIPEDPPPLSQRLGPLGRIDDALFSVEVVIVVTALALMSIMVSTSVLYGRFLELQRAFSEGSGYLTALLGLGFFALMGFAAMSSKVDKDGEPVYGMGARVGGALGVAVGLVAVGYAMLSVSSATVYRLLTIGLMIPVVMTFVRRGETARAGLSGGVALIAVFFMGGLPAGYSWAQSYSLFLLLWVGFLGASMAARVRRHLRVDLMRKLVPEDKLAHFNAVSYLVAALFSGVVCYLGLLYLFGADSSYLKPIWEAPGWAPASLAAELETFPLPQDASMARRALHVVFSPSEPGEPPDWLKVLAIPLSFFLITVRFLGHVLAFGKIAAAGETFSDGLEVH
jgi:TRAP-type C4-dicarboxylate transport system permease small subunit